MEEIIYLIIVIIILILAVVLMPSTKPPTPAETQAKAPTTEDGRSAVRHYGEVWVDDPAMLAWKVVSREPIFTSGGGK